MQVIRSRELARWPRDIVRLSNGEVVLLDLAPDGAFLAAYDAELAPTWSVRLQGKVRALFLDTQRTPWILDAAGVSAVGFRGACATRVDIPVHDGMRVSACALVDNDIIVACDHGPHAPMRPPRVMRVTKQGRVRWSTSLPVGDVAYDGVVQMRADEGWNMRPMDPWKPKTWFSLSSKLHVSNDCLLAAFTESPRSGIGFGYVLSIADGTLRFTTKQGPISETAAFGTGAFLVGYQGYGAFETLRYERDGTSQLRWASHGYYVILGDDVRVIEMENVLPSKMHVARLLYDGTVARGAWLDGYYTSQPYLRDNGTILFLRAGALHAVRDLSVDERLVLAPSDDRLFFTPIVGDGDSVYFAFGSDAVAPRLVQVGL